MQLQALRAQPGSRGRGQGLAVWSTLSRRGALSVRPSTHMSSQSPPTQAAGSNLQSALVFGKSRRRGRRQQAWEAVPRTGAAGSEPWPCSFRAGFTSSRSSSPIWRHEEREEAQSVLGAGAAGRAVAGVRAAVGAGQKERLQAVPIHDNDRGIERGSIQCSKGCAAAGGTSSRAAAAPHVIVTGHAPVVVGGAATPRFHVLLRGLLLGGRRSAVTKP